MLRLLLAALGLAAPALAQIQLARFTFDDDTLASAPASLAAVSELTLSRAHAFGGAPADRWLALTTDWNANGGTMAFTVTPTGGAIRYAHLRWQTRVGTPGLGDSVAAVTVTANGVAIGTVAPLQAPCDYELDLRAVAALRGQPGPVTFAFAFDGNPNGQSGHEIGELSLTGTPCDFAVFGVKPAALPTVTADAFLVHGPGMDTVLGVSFDGVELPPRTAGAFGSGSWEVANPCALFVRPPLCLPGGDHTVTVFSSCGTTNVDVTLVEPQEPTLVCDDEHPAGMPQCFVFHAGGPGPQVPIVVASPVRVPSVAPGLVELAIGDMFSNLFVAFFVGDCIEWCLPIPADRTGDTWHFQGVVWHSGNLDLSQPLPTTDVCTVTWF